MTEEEARQFLRDWWDGVWRRGDLSIVDQFVVERCVHHSARGTVSLTPAEYKDRLVQYQRVLHSAVTTVDDLAVAGEKIWFRATSRGINLETSAPSVVTWMVEYRFEGRRIAEAWVAAAPDVAWNE